MQTKMLSERGLVTMTIDYALPNRMRQVVSSTIQPNPVETILIGREGWTREEGQPWQPLEREIADAMAAQMQETVGEKPEGTLSEFECLGKQPIAGKEYLTYRGEVDHPGTQNVSQEAAAPKSPDRPIRLIIVDPTTGLPARSVYGRADQLDHPIFEAMYTYPADIKIDAPQVAASSPNPPTATKPEEKR